MKFGRGLMEAKTLAVGIDQHLQEDLETKRMLAFIC